MIFATVVGAGGKVKFIFRGKAPGANDDGSGMGMLLEIISILSKNQLQLDYSLHIVAFAGEEQGLVGSNYYAKRVKEEGKSIVAMIQGDMLGKNEVYDSLS